MLVISGGRDPLPNAVSAKGHNTSMLVNSGGGDTSLNFLVQIGYYTIINLNCDRDPHLHVLSAKMSQLLITNIHTPFCTTPRAFHHPPTLPSAHSNLSELNTSLIANSKCPHHPKVPKNHHFRLEYSCVV